MNRIEACFKQLGTKKAVITYVTAGDPALDVTLDIMHGLVDSGVDILELGVPFSDPMADGPTIQRASERSLAHQTSLTDVLDLVRRFRTKNTHTPVILMGYLNPIFRMGYDVFARKAQESGVDGVLTVDAPFEYADDLHRALKKQNLDMIFLIAPTSDQERIQKIAEKASGFIYYVSLKGVTGSGHLDTDAVEAKLKIIQEYTDLPIAVGFGIKDNATAVTIAQCADAIVVGSRLIEILEQNPEHEVHTIKTFTSNLCDAVHRV